MEKGNMYHSAAEETIELLRFRVSEVDKIAENSKEHVIPYQELLSFFFDVKSVLTT